MRSLGRCPDVQKQGSLPTPVTLTASGSVASLRKAGGNGRPLVFFPHCDRDLCFGFFF